MPRPEPPLFGLARYGRDWVPNIYFTHSRYRAEFVRLAGWLCREYHGQVVKRYGGEGDDQKEYWTIRVGESDWLLMRCFYPHGISLGTDRPDDLPTFEAIAKQVGARPVGWRHRWLRLRRRLARRAS